MCPLFEYKYSEGDINSMWDLQSGSLLHNIELLSSEQLDLLQEMARAQTLRRLQLARLPRRH